MPPNSKYTKDGIPIEPRYLALHPVDAGRDAFNRERVSSPDTLFDSKQIFDAQPLYWDDAETSGEGTASAHSTALAASTLSVTADTAGTRVRQTFQRFNYQPGKSQLILMTGTLGAGADGITRRLGYFDDDNGLYFQLSGSVLSVCRRTSVTGSAVNTVVAQSDWNIDTMDGAGQTGFTINTANAQIFFIDFEWLGTGSVRFGFVLDGVMYPVHQMNHANTLTTVYMSSPNLPVRYEIDNDGSGGAASFVHNCSTVISEGGAGDNGIIGYVSTAGTHVDANSADTIYAVVGLRLKAANLGAVVDIASVSLLSETNDNFEWLLLLNPTVAGTFTYTDVTNYSVQKATGATANTVTGGTQIGGGWGSSQTSISNLVYNQRHLGAAIDGTRDTIVLCVRPLSANADIQGSISFREL